MLIAVPTETTPGESRVALVPRSIAKLLAAGATVAIQSGAGSAADCPDAAYIAAGAEIVPDAASLLGGADVVVRVRRPAVAEITAMKDGAILIGLLDPIADPTILAPLLDRRISAFRMEALPRISRAQDMDVLSSQATVGGYYAALLGAFRLPRLLPLFMTAAGTITPARVLVIGAGVAGLQAISTVRRLGAVVEAFDVRPAVKEQVESLGAKFVDIGIDTAETETAGGYAKELSADHHQREQEVLAERCREADIVISTAFIPNKPAPVLITAATVRSMRPGSVIVDLAAPSGGNCELTVLGEERVEHGVLVIGAENLPAKMPAQASQLYSHNVMRFMLQFIKDGAVNVDFDDEVLAATCMTAAGAPRGADIAALLAGAKA